MILNASTYLSDQSIWVVEIFSNNYRLQNTTQKMLDYEQRETSIKTEGEFSCSE
jgi:hypothetical protein